MDSFRSHLETGQFNKSLDLIPWTLTYTLKYKIYADRESWNMTEIMEYLFRKKVYFCKQ